jgi:hypothetical protein
MITITSDLALVWLQVGKWMDCGLFSIEMIQFYWSKSVRLLSEQVLAEVCVSCRN